MSEGVSEFVWGAREAGNVGNFECRASLTLTPSVHADRATLVANAHATANASRAPLAAFPCFLQFSDTL